MKFVQAQTSEGEVFARFRLSIDEALEELHGSTAFAIASQGGKPDDGPPAGPEIAALTIGVLLGSIDAVFGFRIFIADVELTRLQTILLIMSPLALFWLAAYFLRSRSSNLYYRLVASEMCNHDVTCSLIDGGILHQTAVQSIFFPYSGISRVVRSSSGLLVGSGISCTLVPSRSYIQPHSESSFLALIGSHLPHLNK